MIEIGDTVCVNFNTAQYTLCSNAVVINIPIATGDSWIFEDLQNKQEHYVSEGCTVTLLEKKSDREKMERHIAKQREKSK